MAMHRPTRRRLSRTAVPLVLTLLAGGVAVSAADAQPAAAAPAPGVEAASKALLTITGKNQQTEIDVEI